VARPGDFFSSYGITAKRLMTGNAFAYARDRAPCASRLVERFHQTMAREWTTGWPTAPNRHRSRALPHWLEHYSETRPPQLTSRPATDQPRSQRLWEGQLGTAPKHSVRNLAHAQPPNTPFAAYLPATKKAREGETQFEP
jgi:hypothetical protein